MSIWRLLLKDLLFWGAGHLRAHFTGGLEISRKCASYFLTNREVVPTLAWIAPVCTRTNTEFAESQSCRMQTIVSTVERS